VCSGVTKINPRLISWTSTFGEQGSLTWLTNAWRASDSAPSVQVVVDIEAQDDVYFLLPEPDEKPTRPDSRSATDRAQHIHEPRFGLSLVFGVTDLYARRPPNSSACRRHKVPDAHRRPVTPRSTPSASRSYHPARFKRGHRHQVHGSRCSVCFRSACVNFTLPWPTVILAT